MGEEAEGLASPNVAFCGWRLAAFTVIRTHTPHSSPSFPRLSVRLSFSQLPPPSAPACQLGALTSSPSSSRRRSICLLGWQVSMQLFAALHIGRTVFPKLDPPTMLGEREATDTGEERGSEAVGPVRPAAVRCSGSAVHAALVHSCRPEVHKNLKWAKVRWRLDMRGGLCCRPGERKEGEEPARSACLWLPSLRPPAATCDCNA